MFCINCGSKINSGEKFCPNCGTKVEEKTNEVVETQETTVNNQPVVSEQYSTEPVLVVDNQIPAETQPVMSNVPTTDSGNSFENFGQYLNQSQQPGVTMAKKQDGMGTASLVIGVISVVASLFCNVLIIPVAILGLVFGIICKTKGGKKTAGIILNICGIVIPIALLIFAIVVLNVSTLKTEVFYGDGYTLTYDYNWEIVTLSGGQDALEYNAEEAYFAPVGKSALSDYPCDFAKTTCQTTLYNDFHEYWNDSLEDSSLYLYKDSYGFSVLKEDLYIATYDYGKTAYDLRGKYYLIVSKDKDVILSFMTNSDADIVDELHEETLKLLQEIEVETNVSENSSTEESDDNVIYDDDLYNALDSLSNWNRYSNLRSGTLGKLTTIDGGWRMLDDSEQYWKFENGQFWWYQSVNNLNDNYWYGTTKVVTGKDGLALAGLDESKVDSIISQSNGKVTANDIHTIVFTPTKIISGGVDKSATNIPEGTTWTYVWILVDHGSEGIEAQVLNMQTYSTSYYVKLSD